MSRAVVRAQIADYLNSGGVDLLSECIAHPPKITQEGQWFLSQPFAVSGSGALVFVHLAVPQVEKRIALTGAAPGTSGIKWRQYTVRLLCYLRSVKPEAEAAGDDNDKFLDSLVAWMEADHNFGTAPTANYTGDTGPGMIFQATEGGTDGGLDVRIETDVPRLLDVQTTEIFSTVDFECCEVIYI